MKDYLNTEERKEIISLLHLMTECQLLIEANTTTKEEKTNLKKDFTNMKNIVKSITGRLNKSALKTFQNEAEKSKIYLDIYGASDEYARKKESNLDKAYEENKDYFRLIELILHYNCRNCNKCGSKCDFYHELELHHVPELSKEEGKSNCKYAYKK